MQGIDGGEVAPARDRLLDQLRKTRKNLNTEQNIKLSGCAERTACINRIRWTVTGGVLQPAMPATVTFVARVR